jgi:rSAM/selenodomain-associated transferase 1
MNPTALAIFAKTPGLSPVKTRLAERIGTTAAETFHLRAAACVAEVAGSLMPAVVPYWAVAEQAALAPTSWHGFPMLWQGEGELGHRMRNVYAELQRRHDRVLLIGVDIPQVSVALLRTALAALDQPDTPFALGPAYDGGFWLFGGRVPLPGWLWTTVRYSQADTATQFLARLQPLGAVAQLACLHDVDRAEDLLHVQAALAALPQPTAQQCAMQAWLANGCAGTSRCRLRSERFRA